MSKYVNRGIKGKADKMGKCQREEGVFSWLPWYLSDVAEELNITEGPFAFDPTLPDAGCSPSTSWQDRHLAGGTCQPPERRDIFSNTYTHSQTDAECNI